MILCLKLHKCVTACVSHDESLVALKPIISSLKHVYLLFMFAFLPLIYEKIILFISLNHVQLLFKLMDKLHSCVWLIIYILKLV